MRCSFEHLNHMLNIMGKNIFTVLGRKVLIELNLCQYNTLPHHAHREYKHRIC